MCGGHEGWRAHSPSPACASSSSACGECGTQGGCSTIAGAAPPHQCLRRTAEHNASSGRGAWRGRWAGSLARSQRPARSGRRGAAGGQTQAAQHANGNWSGLGKQPKACRLAAHQRTPSLSPNTCPGISATERRGGIPTRCRVLQSSPVQPAGQRHHPACWSHTPTKLHPHRQVLL